MSNKYSMLREDFCATMFFFFVRNDLILYLELKVYQWGERTNDKCQRALRSSDVGSS